MIRKIGVKNFRVFKEYTEFEIRPITLLTGPNNSGKSSFTKLLLLLKNGVTKLNFEEGLHNLTNYEDVLNWENSKDDGAYHSLEISLSNLMRNIKADIKTTIVFDEEGFDIPEFQISFGDKSIYSCYIELIQCEGDDYPECNQFTEILNTNELINLIQNNIILFESKPLENFSATSQGVEDLSALTYEKLLIYKKILSNKENDLDNSDDINLFLDSYEGCLDINLEEFRAVRENFNFFWNHSSLFLNKEQKGLLLYNHYKEIKDADKVMFELFLNGKNVTELYSDCVKAPTFLNEEQSAVGEYFSFNELELLNDLKYYETNFHCSEAVVKKIKKCLKKFLSNEELENLEVKPSKLNKFIFHKTPLLDNKSLWEIMVSNYKNIDFTFSNIDYIKANRSEQNRVVLFNSKKEAYDSYFIFHAGKFLKEIQHIFELPGEIEVKELEHTVYALYIDKTNLADLGFGFSQLMPIILKVIHSKKNTTLIIEEPEANLHPKLQSKLADFFVICQKYYPTIHFVIETHSEYLLRKLQYLTAKKEIKTEDAIIYYFNDDKYVNDNEPKVKPIEITETGGLTDTFGPGFYDESTQLQFELTKLIKSQNN